MSNYFNEAGEPLMDAAAMRYEMYLDSTYEPDPYDDYAYDEPEVDPEDCSHDDKTFRSNGCVDCDICYMTIGTWDERDDEGWPIANYFD